MRNRLVCLATFDNFSSRASSLSVFIWRSFFLSYFLLHSSPISVNETGNQEILRRPESINKKDTFFSFSFRSIYINSIRALNSSEFYVTFFSSNLWKSNLHIAVACRCHRIQLHREEISTTTSKKKRNKKHLALLNCDVSSKSTITGCTEDYVVNELEAMRDERLIGSKLPFLLCRLVFFFSF